MITAARLGSNPIKHRGQS